MVYGSRNASGVRTGRIFSITITIQVPQTPITSAKVHFQGSGQLMLNTLPLAERLADPEVYVSEIELQGLPEGPLEGILFANLQNFG